MSIFSHIRQPRITRSRYLYNFEHKLSYRQGNLVPLRTIEILPGDGIKSLSIECFTRMAPLIFPVMHRMNIKLYAFFVPNRILWDQWEDFITGGSDGTLAPPKPYITLTDMYDESGTHLLQGAGSLPDYYGFPWQNFPAQLPNVGNYRGVRWSSLKYRGYQKIWNDYFRDQNLQDEFDIMSSAGGGEYTLGEDHVTELLTLRNKCWQKDYFTSALPWLQRGPETVMPVSVDMSDVSVDIQSSGKTDPMTWSSQGGADIPEGGVNLGNVSGGKKSATMYPEQGKPQYGLYPSNLSEYLDAVLSDTNPDVASFLVEDLRRAIKVQEWREKNARGGARYNEQIYSHFGVRSSDARLQRPEFLGACSMPISISEVLQSSEQSNADGTPLGEMAGHGISARGALVCRNKFFEEHGYVHILMCCLPRTGYMQGIERTDLKFDKFDYYWPEFAHIGEQAIMQQELFFSQSDSANNSVFGYTPRYAEYQFMSDTVAGEFRDTLKSWHMARDLENPVLNGKFVTSDPTQRIFATQYMNVENMYAQFLFHLDMKRPVLKGATPKI